MERADSLMAAIQDEDRAFRDLIARWPEKWRQRGVPGGSQGLKETIAHLAFWDTFAVDFFRRKLDQSDVDSYAPVDFEKRNRQEMKRTRELPFEEVMRRYDLATRGLIKFLRARWDELSDEERQNFSLPLKHRRHHRMLLNKALEPLLKDAERRSQAGEA